MMFLNDFRDWWRGYTFGGRSGNWPTVRKRHLKEHPLCEVCDTAGTLLNRNEVHHVLDYSHYPKLELLDTNLMTLCRRCHLLFGHLNSWRSINKDVRQDAAIWAKKIALRP